jgi:hypothetical protein
MDLEELVIQIESGKDDARDAIKAAEDARDAAREWAIRLIEKIHPLEARALGRAAELGSVLRSPVVAALIILAASGESKAAKALRALGVRSGIVEIGGQGGRAVVDLRVGRAAFKFFPPACSRGAWFSWRESPQGNPSSADESPSRNPPLGARARVKHAR